MAVYKRIQKIDGYTMMSNYHLRDMNLSLKASGLLSLVLSLPADWKYSVSGLTAIVKEGKSAVMSALKELEENGYLSRMEYRENGRFQGVEYIFLEYPGQLEDIENPKGHEQIIQKMQREVAEKKSIQKSRNNQRSKMKKTYNPSIYRKKIHVGILRKWKTGIRKIQIRYSHIRILRKPIFRIRIFNHK